MSKELKNETVNNNEIKGGRKGKTTSAVFLCIIIVLSFCCGFLTNLIIKGNKSETSWVISMIDKYYYSEEDGKVKKFTDEDYAKAIATYLLDEYSEYYTSEEFADVIRTDRGNYFGFGISLLRNSDALSVYYVTPNSPAYKSGLKKGDEIIACEYQGESYSFDKKSQLFDFFGKVNENESITIYFRRNGEEKSATIIKSVFITSYVVYRDKDKTGEFISEGTNPLSFTVKDGGTSILNEDTAYISLHQFQGGAGSQIKTAMNYMKEAGKTKLILDLRDNGGGDMDVLREISSYLISSDEKNPVIAYSKDKNGNYTAYQATGNNFNNDIEKITVLANRNTASASECLIGAMLYYKSAFNEDCLIIESEDGVARTFGKGIMQTTMVNALTQTAIKLTTAYIYQPDKKTCIHGQGITASGENAVNTDKGIERALDILNY
ncbi:MAG: hypothetical protein IJR66_04685 [Clostridia bacterium]|nr:hypothetical protein [Clostridia bacterium]